MMIAQVCGLGLGDFIHTFGDAHIYTNHLEQVNLQLSRDPKPFPKMQLNTDIKSLFEFDFADFELIGYDPHPAIKAPVAI
jgi:thymidylate synthase